MVKTTNVYMPGGDAKILYKKSIKITTSYSSYASNLSSLLSFYRFKNGAAPIRTPQPKKYCNKGGKLMRDISIETEVCKLRSYFKNKKTKCIGKRSTSGTSKYSTHCSASGPRRRKQLDSTKQYSKQNTNFNRNRLIKENLRQLFLEWIRTHEVCHEYDKHDAEKVVDLIMHNLNVYSSNSSKNSSQDTTTKLKKFLKFLSCDSLNTAIDDKASVEDELKGNIISAKIPHSRCTVPSCIEKGSKQYQMISTLSVPRHIAIEKFCEPNQLSQQLYSIWISRQASKFYTDSSNLNYSVFSSESISINPYSKKIGTRYILSKVQIGEQSLPIMPEDRKTYSYDSKPFQNRECVVFLEKTTNVGLEKISIQKTQSNQDANRKVFVIDQFISSADDIKSYARDQQIEELKIRENTTDLSLRNEMLYEATMIYKINKQTPNEQCDTKKEYEKTNSKILPKLQDTQHVVSEIDVDLTCKKFCERATSDKEISLDVSRDKQPSKKNKNKNKVSKEKYEANNRKNEANEGRENEQNLNKHSLHKSNTNSEYKFQTPKFLPSFVKLRHKNSYNIHKLFRKSSSKRPKKSNKEDSVDPVQKLIKDVESLFRTVTNKEDNLKIDIKINVLKKPVVEKKHATTSNQEKRIPRKLLVPEEIEYPNKKQVADLKREISTKQLILYENQLDSSAEFLKKRKTLSETTDTTANVTDTSNPGLEYSESSDSSDFRKPSSSLIRKKSRYDRNSKLLSFKTAHVPKIGPIINTSANSKTTYLFKHSLPNIDFFEQKNKRALYQVVNNMHKRPSVQEISEELKELRLVLQKLAATASKLIASHANKINRQQQQQIRYLSTGTEAPIPKSHVKSIRLMTTRETQKSKINTIQREINTETLPKPKQNHSQSSGKKSIKKDPKKKDVIVKNLRLVKKSTSYNVIESETILKVTDMTSAANRSLKRSADATLTYLYRKSNSKLKQTKTRNTTGYYYEGIVNRLRTHPQYIYDVCNYVPSCILSNKHKVEYYCSNKRRDRKYTSYFLQTFSVPSLYDCNPISLFGSDQCSDCCCDSAGKIFPESNNLWKTMLKTADGKCNSNSKTIRSDDDKGINDDQCDSSKNCVNVTTYEDSVTAELSKKNDVNAIQSIPISTQISKHKLAIDEYVDSDKCAYINDVSKINKLSSTRIDIDESQPLKRVSNGWTALRFWEKIIFVILFWIAILILVWVVYAFVIKPFTDSILNAKTRPTVIEIVPGPAATNKGANTYNISHIYVNDELMNLTNVYVKLSDLGF